MVTLRVGLCPEASFAAELGEPISRNDLDVLILPELLDGGYASLQSGKTPHQQNSELLASFRKLSRDSSMCIIAGSVFFREGHRRTNSSFVFQGGRLSHRYDKIHLFRPCNDHRYFKRGNSISTFWISGRTRIKAGVIICYDLRFPEISRLLARQGAKILFVPARWPSARDEAWQTLLKARAIENQIFVVGCNATGAEGGWSYVFGPEGQLLYSNRGSDDRGFGTVALDLTDLSTARTLHDNIREAIVLRGLKTT